MFCDCRMDVSSKWTPPKCHNGAKMQNKKNGMQTRESASNKNSCARKKVAANLNQTRMNLRERNCSV